LAIDRSTIDDAAFEDKEEDILEVNSLIFYQHGMGKVKHRKGRGAGYMKL
jgi:hypothetical protein